MIQNGSYTAQTSKTEGLSRVYGNIVSRLYSSRAAIGKSTNGEDLLLPVLGNIYQILMPLNTLYVAIHAGLRAYKDRFYIVYADDSSVAQDQSSSIDKLPADSHDDEPITFDDNYWEEKRQGCWFCRTFLESPCSQQFKEWHQCVETNRRAGNEFVVECKEISKALFECTELNKVLMPGETSGDDNGDNTDSGNCSEVSSGDNVGEGGKD